MKKWAVAIFLLSGLLFTTGTVLIMVGSVLKNYTIMKLSFVFYFIGVLGIILSLIFIYKNKKNV